MKRTILLLFCILPVMAFAELPFSVDDWAIQLKGYDAALNQIKNSKFDLVVIDYARFGTENSEFSVSDIQKLKGGPCPDKIVLAYINIGETEPNRFYSSFLPSNVIEDCNPDLQKCRVKFWIPAWKSVLRGVQSGARKSYLDRIIDAGFDGIYIDGIDSFQFWGPAEIGGNNTKRVAAREMIKLVRQLAAYSRVTREQRGFIIIPQDGTNIITPDAHVYASNPTAQANAQKQKYFAAIDGIGAQETFFSGPRENNNPLRPKTEVIALLEEFLAADNTVLAVDYLTNSTKISNFFKKAKAENFVPYANRRALDTLRISSQFPPTCHGSTLSVTCNATPRNVEVGDDVNFSASVSGTGIATYFWQYGDGSSSTSQSPSHQYNLAGSYNPKVTVTRGSATGECKTSRITVSGTSGGDPDIAVDPTSLNMNITQGNSTQENIIVSNEGEGTLTIGEPFTTGDDADNCYDLSLQDDCSDLPDGDSCTITVTCSGVCPTQIEDDTTVQIPSNDPDEDPKIVNVVCEVGE